MSRTDQTAPLIQRATLLLQQHRLADAERELRQLLAQDPHHAWGHASLAMCLLEREQLDEAQREAEAAIVAEPEYAFVHWVRGSVMGARNRLAEARAAFEEALRLDPSDGDNYESLSSVLLSQQRSAEALDVAERGLRVDPEHVGCQNMRAMALVKLGRNAEAGATLQTALARDPDNAVTHANRGWSLLHEGDPNRAMEHFREALRLDPNSEWARSGIVEAMKARNPLYRWLLGFFLWMSRLTPGQRWTILIGGWIGFQVLSNLRRNNASVAPYIWPLTTAYILFVWLTWLAPPLFNAMLRLDRNGRHALSRQQLVTSNWMLGLLALALIAFIGAVATGAGWLVLAAVVALLLTIPVSTIWKCERGWPRWSNVAIAAGLAAIGCAVVALDALSGPLALIERLVTIFIVGTLIASIAVQQLRAATPRR